ncbi:MAG: hypothetical protein HWN65_13950 [Candidatus Helarchaeota archaeon]|nr:hypothetical protein [Candidatus Helarchaeota archaeon]
MAEIKSPKKFVVLTIILAAFFLNLLWEVSHSMLYDWDKAPLINNIYVYIPRILGASCLDAFFIFIIILLNSLLRRSFQWVHSPRKRDYMVLIILGVVAAICIEWVATIFNMWSYNEFMPIIFGVGLTPLIQLAITGAFSLYVSTKIKWK